MEHPLIKKERVEEREYQLSIAKSCFARNTLVVLPTGMGKTVIALLVIAEVLTRKSGKVLFLAPTKPLVEQHYSFLREYLVDPDVAMFTGEVSPEERELLWRQHRIVVSTPQVIENDIRYERISLDNVSLVVFDEAHRAVGDYSYVFVAESYRDVGGLVMGMTASPGSDPERILEVCRNLGISGVEIRAEYDPDVVNYIHDIAVHVVRVEMSEESCKIRDLLRAALNEQVEELRRRGFLRERRVAMTRDLLDVQSIVQERLRSGEKNYNLYLAATAQAIALKINHAIELVETQGIEALKSYMARLEEEAGSRGSTRASRSLFKDEKVKEAFRLARAAPPESRKVEKVMEVVREQFSKKEDSKVIVFTHYRDTSELVTKELSTAKGVRPVRFIGQANRGEELGMSQKEQAEILNKFRDGIYNVIVSTSVGEEGLDLPATDFVVFYEPVPSEIRTIQRRGRTGRTRPGSVFVITMKDTRDEVYLYSAKRKERKMHQELEKLREQLKQRILVGGPRGEAFLTPSSIMETSKRVEEAKERVPETGKAPRLWRKGQASLKDFVDQ